MGCLGTPGGNPEQGSGSLPTCDTEGVLAAITGIIGSIESTEALKLLLGLGDDLSGRLLTYDSLEQSFRTYKINRDPKCPACSLPPEQITIAEYDEHCSPHPVSVPA